MITYSIYLYKSTLDAHTEKPSRILGPYSEPILIDFFGDVSPPHLENNQRLRILNFTAPHNIKIIFQPNTDSANYDLYDAMRIVAHEAVE